MNDRTKVHSSTIPRNSKIQVNRLLTKKVVALRHYLPNKNEKNNKTNNVLPSTTHHSIVEILDLEVGV